MDKAKKKPDSRPLLYLAIISLLVIIAVLAKGTMQGKYNFFLKRGNGSFVLGVSDFKLTEKTTEAVEKMLEGATKATREELGKKASETQVKLKSALEKEVKDLTSAQIKSIQTNICRDWGIVKE